MSCGALRRSTEIRDIQDSFHSGRPADVPCVLGLRGERVLLREYYYYSS